jgi:hypothetical protein
VSDYTGGLQEGGPIRVENAISVTSHPEIRPPWLCLTATVAAASVAWTCIAPARQRAVMVGWERWVDVTWADFGRAANAGMGIGAERIERSRTLDVNVRSAPDR